MHTWSKWKHAWCCLKPSGKLTSLMVCLPRRHLICIIRPPEVFSNKVTIKLRFLICLLWQHYKNKCNSAAQRHESVLRLTQNIANRASSNTVISVYFPRIKTVQHQCVLFNLYYKQFCRFQNGITTNQITKTSLAESILVFTRLNQNQKNKYYWEEREDLFYFKKNSFTNMKQN